MKNFMDVVSLTTEELERATLEATKAFNELTNRNMTTLNSASFRIVENFWNAVNTELVRRRNHTEFED